MDANCNVIIFWRRVPFCFEGSPGDHVCIVDISLEEEAYFVEGSSEVEHCNVGNEQKVCIIV